MPKNNKVTKVANVLKKQKVAAKLRIGTRKSGKSGHTMTTDALKAVLTNKSQARHHSAAATVLRSRGVVIEWPTKLAA